MYSGYGLPLSFVWSEVSYEIVSVCPFLHVFVQTIHRNWDITFLWDLECVRRPYVIASDRTDVFGENAIWAKKDQKWSEITQY